MSFLNVLKEEISKTKSNLPEGKKWFKRGDLEQERERRYREEMEQLEREREEKRKKRKLEQGVDSNSPSAASTSNGEAENTESPSPVLSMPRPEVIRRLRLLGQPATLFGESDSKRFDRLKRIEAAREEHLEGQRNDFAEAIKDSEAESLKKHYEYSEEHAADPTANGDHGSASGNGDGANKAKKDKSARLTAAQIHSLSEDIFAHDMAQIGKEEYVRLFLKKVMKLWQDELECREESIAKSKSGKMETAILKQTKNYIEPLFTTLKKKTCPDDILTPLIEIVEYCKQREYVKANDAYLRMSIGNAPWPMGVTMVGIHERSAREKINNQNIAHILNDEKQRKYIQSVKRLMTYCQKRFPNDPSKMVLN